MTWWQIGLAAATLVLSGFGVRDIIQHYLKRGSQQVSDKQTIAQTAQTLAETEKVRVQSAREEVDLVREVLSEVRANSEEKDKRIGSLEARVGTLESWVRSTLSFMTAHMEWDQNAYHVARQVDPDFPAPPPLTAPVPEQ